MSSWQSLSAKQARYVVDWLHVVLDDNILATCLRLVLLMTVTWAKDVQAPPGMASAMVC